MTRRRAGLVALAVVPLACGALAVVACDRLATNLSGGADPRAGLLRGKLPVASLAVTHAARLTDGIAAEAGDPGRTDLTTELSRPDALVTWDLGVQVPVRCVLIDADGEGTFTLSLSADGKDFRPLYRAPVDEDRGQQLRAARELGGTGRYLSLAAAGGGGPRSVSEVSAWSECPKTWPPLAMQKGTPDAEAVRLKLWAFAVLAVAYIFAYRRRAPDWLKLLGVAPAGMGIALAVQLVEIWPPSGELTPRLVGVGAALVAAVVVRAIVVRASAGRKAAPPPAASQP